MVTLRALTEAECELARRWREAVPESLRTPYVLTAAMQQAFYREVVCNRQAPHRYWALVTDDRDPGFVGVGGLTDIAWENGHAEISLILNPEARGQGYGEAAVDALLAVAFERMRLLTVVGECYESNIAGMKFWAKVAERHKAEIVRLGRRKWWGGSLYGALHFTIAAERWAAKEVTQ